MLFRSAGEDGPYRAAGGATLRAVGRQVWGPLFPECRKFIAEEIKKLEAAGLVRGVLHPTWLANPVVVRKANGKWRLCIDFTDLNKACPKDPFPLSCIDQIADSTSGCDMLSFLDAYSPDLHVQRR